MRTRLLAAVLCALSLGACGGSDSSSEAAATTTSSSSTTTTTTLPPPGVERFFAEIQASGYAEKLGATGGAINDPGVRGSILRLAHVVCEGIESVGYESEIRILMDTQAHPTQEQAAAFVDSTLRNICPEVRP